MSEAEHRERLTEQFFRAPESEAISGTSLGLTLVEAIDAAASRSPYDLVGIQVEPNR